MIDTQNINGVAVPEALRVLRFVEKGDTAGLWCLWLGCSEVHVPVEADGVIYHANVANLAGPTDIGCLAALQYAVEVAKVQTIIVCGHHDCAAVGLAVAQRPSEALGNWLAPIARTRHKFERFLDRISSEVDRVHALAELNAIEQAYNISRTTIVERAWNNGQNIGIFAWVQHRGRRSVAALDFAVDLGSDIAAIYGSAIAAVEKRWEASTSGALSSKAPTSTVLQPNR